jgi:hypothetical protein
MSSSRSYKDQRANEARRGSESDELGEMRTLKEIKASSLSEGDISLRL